MTYLTSIPVTYYRAARVENVNVFYREAGPSDAPVVLLLHGCEARSQQQQHRDPPPPPPPRHGTP